MGKVSLAVETEDFKIFRDIYWPVKTNMYCIISDGEGILIDPFESEGIYELLIHNEVSAIKILLTHEHFDHTSGVKWFQSKFQSTLICQSKCSESIANPKNNRPVLVSFILKQNGFLEEARNLNYLMHSPYALIADVTFNQGYTFQWHGVKIHMQSTPGHTPGSSCIQVGQDILMTGDTLIKGEPIITRFPGGNRDVLKELTAPYLKNICSKMIILPGHGDIFRMGEIDLDKIISS